MGLLTRIRNTVRNTVKGFLWQNSTGIELLSDSRRLSLRGDEWQQPLTALCLQWYYNNFPEAELVAEQWENNEWVETETGRSAELVALINRPNPYYSHFELWAGTLLSWFCDGNAYWYIVSDKSNRARNLWYLPHSSVKIVGGSTTNELIRHYEYRVGSTIIEIPRERIVHFRNGIDPLDMKRGLSPLATLLRELLTDQEATQYTQSMLQNLGIPGALISPADPNQIIPSEQAELIKTTYQQRLTGSERGSAIVFPVSMKIDYPEMNPEKMLLAKLRDIPETRIAAAFGLPPVVVGLLAGMQYTSTYNNMIEARDAAYESGILPLQRRFAHTIMTAFALPDNERVAFDNSDIRALQDDMLKRAQELEIGVRGGWVTVAEARRAMGLEADPTQEVFLRPANIVEWDRNA